MATPFRPAIELLTEYARYHRDRRNIITHFVGIPMIVFGIAVLLARPALAVGSMALTPAWAAVVLVTLWYVTRGELMLGMLVSGAVGVLAMLAHQVAGGSVALWLTWGIPFFVIGWLIQFVGHYYEGRKPAFTDDLVGLLVGPMFVALEMLASLGLFRRLVAEIESRAGPTVLRNLAHPA